MEDTVDRKLLVCYLFCLLSVLLSFYFSGHKPHVSNFDSPSGSDGRTVVPPDYLDKTSVGGESGASADYEAVSLIEETGTVFTL